MDREQEIHFVYEHGVLRPEERLDLPEGTRGVARIRGAAPRSDSAARRRGRGGCSAGLLRLRGGLREP